MTTITMTAAFSELVSVYRKRKRKRKAQKCEEINSIIEMTKDFSDVLFLSAANVLTLDDDEARLGIIT